MAKINIKTKKVYDLITGFVIILFFVSYILSYVISQNPIFFIIFLFIGVLFGGYSFYYKVNEDKSNRQKYNKIRMQWYQSNILFGITLITGIVLFSFGLLLLQLILKFSSNSCLLINPIS